MLFALVVTATAWISFRTALAGSYPQLRLSIPFLWGGPALLMAMLGAGIAGVIQSRGRRTARDAMLSGSLLASGISCMLFIAMTGFVRPFALAYDLTAVIMVMVLGSVLCGLAFRESVNPTRRQPMLVGAGLIALAVAWLMIGSLASILPFEGWMAAVSQTDNLASSPVAIIVTAEVIVVLLLSLFGSLVDSRIAARDQLETDRLRQLADSTLEGILIHNDGVVLDGNSSIASLLGLKLSDLRGSNVASFVAPKEDALLWQPGQGTIPAETVIVTADGEWVAVEILSRPLSYGGNHTVVTVLRDVRERQASEERIRFLAHHDVLTGLPNRAKLAENLATALQLAERNETSLSILCLDLDGFKRVNDTLGHMAGDELLCQVADRVRASLRDSDLFARIGGDEFVVLHADAQPEQTMILARRIIACIAQTFEIKGQEVSVGTSIGIAVYPNDGVTATALLQHGDIALYRAKENGRGCFCLFETGMDLALRMRCEMETELRGAIQRDELMLNFQPLFDAGRKLISFEALVRWTHPTLGLIPPSDFIPIAEECGLIVSLGAWVLRRACHEAMRWDRDCRIAVNLSPIQFRRSDMTKTVATILQETGLPAWRLELEITEGVLIEDADGALATLQDLRRLGVRLVLDDFGTGYSSLSYLHRFPFDKLKVDRSFVRRLELDAQARAIVKAIILMGRSLDLEVTAEGVETVEQFELLCAQGCQEMQGFLLGRPMPQHSIEGFLSAHDAQEGRIGGSPSSSLQPRLTETIAFLTTSCL
ncbi:MAG: putative bifunctional diguanylate cyclase/phosphodiesterase [Janthinobacterium lividum]